MFGGTDDMAEILWCEVLMLVTIDVGGQTIETFHEMFNLRNNFFVGRL